MKHHGLNISRAFAVAILGTTLVAFPARAQTAPTSNPAASVADDPYLWLEDVGGDKALDWVRQQNAVSTNELQARPEFEPIRQRLLSIMDSKDRIPFVSKHGKFVYNFWRDDKNVRGLWRRTTLDDYKKPQPDVGNGARPGSTRREQRRRIGFGNRPTCWSRITIAASFRFRAAARTRRSCASLI